MEKIIKLATPEEALALYGNLDENLRFAEKEYQVRISARNYQLKIIGNKQHAEAAYRFFLNLLHTHRSTSKISSGQAAVGEPEIKTVKGSGLGKVQFFHRGKIIQARSQNQERYLEAIRDKSIVFAIGPAGTGKTYLAMAAAIDALKKKRVTRIILTRPAVEAGESLGFLPGDLYAKVNPYLRPLYDALYDMMEFEEAARYLERGVIEVAPLAYMRGRTLNDSFVILDEAQNCAHSQMKMFLTRLGEFSRAVITGDVTQIDLPGGKKSGLVEVQSFLKTIKGIAFIYFNEADVVRHPLVKEIIKAYDKHERKD
ncbi:MAG: PhoH family protein [Candidatus Omnitrophica bacterium]|nr:PhoH family protein [Candidatus Omnitrophota bacterium]